MTLDESEAQYELVGRNPMLWLEKAHELHYGAVVLKDRLVEITTNTPPARRRGETNGLVASSLLLLGLSFENLIKGVYVARNPALVDRNQLDRSEWKADSGHGIAEFAASLMNLEPDEKDLLLRLQEYIVWAGRYQIPTKSSRYHDSHSGNKHRLVTTDFVVAARLFEKLKEQLIDFRSLNPRV